jgi:hypothetical protein
MPAITADHPFLFKHEDKIHAVLSCFDRVIVRGYLPICHPRGLMGWLHQQGLKYWKLKEFGPQIAERLLNHAKDLAKSQQREYRYLPTRQSKEELAREIATRDKITEGLVCVFSCLETCSTFRLKYGKGKPRLEKDLRRCTVLYYFFMDEDCGLIHVKLHTWLPLTCQVYVNGHSWLERQLARRQLKYQTVDNAFVHLRDPAAAQRLADRFIKQNWRRHLDRWARLVNPLLGQELGGQRGPFEYYWVVDQAEYSTDVIFKDADALKDLYPALVEHATLCLGSEDVLRFLGRKPNGCFKGDVQTERKRVPIEGKRKEGVRVKHVMKTNRLKMYDKEGVVLRIETVINDPTEFRVRRWQSKHGKRRLAWLPMRKSVSWLWRYLQVALSANRRYLEALAVVNDPQPARELLDRVCQPAKLGKRRRRALQPLSPLDQALFLGALCGEHHLHGLRNADLTRHLYGEEPPKDPNERRRRSARVTRPLQLLRAHGLIAKVPRARRYRVTPKGLTLMSAAIYVRYKHLPKAFQEAVA